jgi:NhaP-type Na+/H+ or K+/H+ antiporter
MNTTIKRLPIWVFAFEGVMGGAFDLLKSFDGAWMILAAAAAINVVVGLTVLRGRSRLVRAMLKKGRTRQIMFGLVALRIGVHVLLGAAGVEVAGPAAHLALATVMAGVTVGLLWFDQRVTFRALGLA